MNMPQKHTMPPRGSGDRPDAVERWLRAFFQAEMPAHWPTPSLPEPPHRRWLAVRSAFGSRLALAASVALLLLGSLFLAGRFQSVEPASGGPGHGPVIGSKNRGIEKTGTEQNKNPRGVSQNFR